ncbi:VOC family protein [Modestobacter altitudinis]|uniref:VOC family protein n=1 Tax=Modestobacter altitudinis TaxID=2213158 RepID=UPI00110D06EA|nr:VOC family protein [Modestobacter altitudinis]
MSGRVVHFEIPFDDGERARGFYREAFGWDLQSMPEMGYTLVSTGPNGEQGPSEPGFINGGMMSRTDSPSPGPILVVDVEGIDKALARIGELGGTVLVPRQPVGDMGFSAYVRDPEGNVVGLWETAR